MVVFHDSLLPRYRGFAPLVSALVNGEKKIGVSALFASEEYDRGEIISQKSADIDYPLTIKQAIDIIIPCYEELTYEVVSKLLGGGVCTQVQDESIATYSLWRDSDDYFIDWSWDAPRIKRFIDALGYPYEGAKVIMEDKIWSVWEAEVLPEVVVENRMHGKVIFIQDENPVIVCGSGLLKLLRITDTVSGQNVLPLQKFRIRFKS